MSFGLGRHDVKENCIYMRSTQDLVSVQLQARTVVERLCIVSCWWYAQAIGQNAWPSPPHIHKTSDPRKHAGPGTLCH